MTITRSGASWSIRRLVSLAALAVLSVFAACGGSNGSRAGDDAIGTLAYVNSSCEESGGKFRLSQSLRILHGDEELTVVELQFPPVAGIGLCLEFGRNRNGKILLFVGALQRLGVSPDGERVVFEITDDFSATSTGWLAAGEEGIFSVDADGSGLKRIAAASRYPNSNIASADPVYRFTADGRTIGFTDLGPGPDGEDAAQIFMFDLASGARTQVTHLPRSDHMAGPEFFVDGRLGFAASGIGDTLYYTVLPDGSELTPLQPLPDLPGGAFLPNFQITGQRLPIAVNIPDRPSINPTEFGVVREVFVSDGDSTVQVTNFNREDTARFGTDSSLDGERLFFTASVDLGENPAEICQVFSASLLGADIRQLTHFSQDHRSLRGCGALVTDGCRAGSSFASDGTDARSGMFIFDSTCDPFGTTPYGEQIYAIRPDGTGLRQLTYTQGFIRGPDRSGTTELPGPWAYGPHL